MLADSWFTSIGWLTVNLQKIQLSSAANLAVDLLKTMAPEKYEFPAPFTALSVESV